MSLPLPKINSANLQIFYHLRILAIAAAFTPYIALYFRLLEKSRSHGKKLAQMVLTEPFFHVSNKEVCFRCNSNSYTVRKLSVTTLVGLI